jgi:small subunit ribosomal protein S18
MRAVREPPFWPCRPAPPRTTCTTRYDTQVHGPSSPAGNGAPRWPSRPAQAERRRCASSAGEGHGVDYKDTALLRKYISDRGKIRARRVTGNCVQHQRDVAMAVKNAREVALLPYTSTAR